ncbi:heat shock protein DnaJ-like protein [Rhodanobacter fulvus Jip2]|uniref:Heat shock protein DnaJ-like protein n=1 Tax=Rhodanobacter fulvus Jip2 TaxID=1163408 RepID=I4VM15_9GAMM|nr:heat shock protein DnaJ-like protein [Rhodanobacter fulvus Jip2]
MLLKSGGTSVASSASAADIKTAFRRKAMEYHPDRCKLPNATTLFQLVNHAFSVLGDPESRARYDTSTVETSDTASPSASRRAAPDPIRCSVCNKVSAQPRYVIFYRVYSFIVMTRREAIQGIYCSTCAEKECLKATAFTWALAWWGFPWGPIYGLQAIFTNLTGGKRPADINARVPAHQAWYFAAAGQMDVARAVAEQALALALKVSPGKDDETARLRAQLDAFIASFPSASRTPQLKDTWALGRRPFFVQTGILTAVVAAVAFFALRPDSPSFRTTPDYSYLQNSPSKSHQPYTPTPPPDSQSPANAVDFSNQSTPASSSTTILSLQQALAKKPSTPPKPPYVRPVLAPNGRSWPITEGYIKGVPQKYTNGYSEITIDNGQNEGDVFVKVVSIPQGAKAFPIRQFFVPAHGSFVVKKIRAGTYDVRYQDLDTGAKSGSPSFELTETSVPGGIEYTHYELTLYTVANGNMKMRPLADDEF